MRKKTRLAAALLALTVLLCTGAAQGQTEKMDALAILKDSSIDLSPYEGKAVFLNFFTEWCGYCMREMPEIKKIFEEYRRDELEIILVHVWNGEDERNSESVRETFGLEEMTFFEDQDMGLSQFVGLQYFPTSIFIDKDGYLVAALSQALTYEQMVTIMEEMGIGKAAESPVAPEASAPPPTMAPAHGL